MTPPPRDAPRAELERWFTQRLLSLDTSRAPPGAPPDSDWDLNPETPAPVETLARAAVLVGLVERAAGLQLILTRRAEGLARHPGQIAFAGGRIEPDESVVEAALREAQEEIGLEPQRVRPIGLGDGYRTITGFHVTPVVAFVDACSQLRPNEAEVAEVFEASFAWAMDPVNVVRGGHDVGGATRRYDVLEHDGRRIWGATAGLLRGLRRRLCWD